MNKQYQEWLNLALSKGLDECEFKIVENTNLSLSVYEGVLEKNEFSESKVLLIKGILNNKASNIKLEDLSLENIDKMLDRLLLSVKHITSSEPALIFEGSNNYIEVENELFDFSKINPKDKVDLLLKIENGISSANNIDKVAETSYSEHLTKTTIVNTKGLNLERNYGIASVFAYGVYKKEEQSKTALSYQMVTNFNNFNETKIIEDNIVEGNSQLGARSIKSNKYPVVFSNEQFGYILSAFSNIYTAEAKYRKLTKLDGKENLKIANEIVNLVDDPFHKDSLIKINFDDEGVACKKHYLIKDGIFKGFIHNLKTAKIYNEEPTGHGFGSGISNNNLLLEPGKLSLDEIFKTIDEGIYIKDLIGLHAGVESVSGNFSLQASGFLIKDGKINRPVDMIVLSGNYFDLLNDIELIGNDFIFGLSGVGSSSVKIKNLTVAGN